MKYKNRLLLNVFLFVLVFVSLSSTAFANEFNSKFSNKNYQSIFYVNDLHGQLAPMNKINNAELQFEAFVSKNKNIDAFKFSAGDIFIGSNEQDIKKATELFQLINQNRGDFNRLKSLKEQIYNELPINF